jgi:hypothetical protein
MRPIPPIALYACAVAACAALIWTPHANQGVHVVQGFILGIVAGPFLKTLSSGIAAILRPRQEELVELSPDERYF